MSHLTLLQQQLPVLGVDALFVPSSDEHLNEYVLPHTRRREWLSGFTGSAGDALITADNAWLFADSRYHVQADLEVDLNQWQVCKLGLPDALPLEAVLQALGAQTAGLRLGVHAGSLLAQTGLQLQQWLKPVNGHLAPLDANPIDALWQAQTDAYPAFSPKPATELPLAFTGQTTEQKLTDIRQALKQAGADALPIIRLDQLAWLLNWRGSDVPYNPLFVGYGLLTPDCLHLFCATDDTPAFDASVVKRHPYDAYVSVLRDLGPRHRWLVDASHLDWQTLQTIPDTHRVKATHPVVMKKAVKHPAEQQAMRRANRQASAAIIHLLAWLDEQLTHGQTLSEHAVAQQLEAFYADQPNYAGQSFNTIAGTGAHGAIVHYGTPNPDTLLQPGELFLLDSGAQYLGGTTDTTRTVCVGQPDERQRFCYTQVLKAHIALSSCVFPPGTNGAQLDGITRASLWQAGLDYGHGTGHGVGAFLCVHEGPNGIHKAATTAFKPGMITSIEPGYYQPGWGGIRLENLGLCVLAEQLPGKQPAATEANPPAGWLGFEPLTWVPFDLRLVDAKLLTSTERQWLADYHRAVLSQVKPLVRSVYQTWLSETCTRFIALGK